MTVFYWTFKYEWETILGTFTTIFSFNTPNSPIETVLLWSLLYIYRNCDPESLRNFLKLILQLSGRVRLIIQLVFLTLKELVNLDGRSEEFTHT